MVNFGIGEAKIYGPSDGAIEYDNGGLQVIQPITVKRCMFWRPSARDQEADLRWHAQCVIDRPDLWPQKDFRLRWLIWIGRKRKGSE